MYIASNDYLCVTIIASFMKKRMFLWLFGLLLFAVASSAQEVTADVVTAFDKGNPQVLAPYLDKKVNLLIETRQLSVDRQKALSEVKSFFSSHKVHNFSLKHKGQREETSFIIGILSTAECSFRVHCFFQKTGNKYVIHQIRIEKTNEK